MDEVKITIIGAGVAGLAIAAELSSKYDSIVALEKHNTFGQETSSRNSEVVHAGIYYQEGSLKARLCIEGAQRLYELCEINSIPHKRLGKLIVATDQSELPVIEELLKKGERNGARDLKLLSKNEIGKLEPHTNAVAALYSPDTGIIDSHSLMKHFHTVSESNGVLFAFNSEVEILEKEDDWFIVGVRQENYKLKSKVVINCAGLASDHIANMAGIDIEKNKYKLKYCKGSYFSYAEPSPVKMLVYPVPHDQLTGLGVHATLDMGGRLRFGPDTEYVDHIDYKVDINKKGMFYKGALKIIPGLHEDSFVPDMAGIRPKLQGPGEKTRDFIIAEESDKKLNGLINLIGIESPGLTAAPAIAKMVSGIVDNLKI
ncbi:MAG: NAD(P)/FAD-dependent oxidoreductase [Nitrospiraceae bacterium]|nr:MAG: NAD(P)/FAD-dependent oxidoreductase [Nitrospiraceae bacterium]